MYIGHQLGLTVPQLREMNISEYCLWYGYFKVKKEMEDIANRPTSTTDGRKIRYR